MHPFLGESQQCTVQVHTVNNWLTTSYHHYPVDEENKVHN